MQNAMNELISFSFFFFGINGKTCYCCLFVATRCRTQHLMGSLFNGLKIWFNWMHTTCTALNLCFYFAAHTLFIPHHHHHHFIRAHDHFLFNQNNFVAYIKIHWPRRRNSHMSACVFVSFITLAHPVRHT